MKKDKIELALITASIAAVEVVGVPLFGGLMMLTVLGCRLEDVRERLQGRRRHGRRRGRC